MVKLATRRDLIVTTAGLPVSQFAASGSSIAATPPKVIREPNGGAMPTQDLASHDAKAPVIVFDVNETILDFNVLRPVFARIFGDPDMVRTWFDNVVVYSEALMLAGDYVDSGPVGVAVSRCSPRPGGAPSRPLISQSCGGYPRRC